MRAKVRLIALAFVILAAGPIQPVRAATLHVPFKYTSIQEPLMWATMAMR